jgi:hypothetical protein
VRNSDFSSSVARITNFSIQLTCSVALLTVRLRWYIVWHATSCYDHVPGLPPTCPTAAFLAAALRFLVFAAFLPANLSFLVLAAFFAAKLRFVGMGIPFVT